jgi:hypothetical protein
MTVSHLYPHRVYNIPDDDWDFIIAAVEAGWKSPRIWRDCPGLTWLQVVKAARMCREELGIDGRRKVA